MLTPPPAQATKTNFFSTDLLLQLDTLDPLLRLAQVILWLELDNAFAKHYSHGQGKRSKLIP